jgi:hypothetical protein
MKEIDQATSAGHNLKRLIETIYNEGRPQIVYGGKLFLLGDLLQRKCRLRSVSGS